MDNQKSYVILDKIELKDHLVGNASENWEPLVNDKSEWKPYIDNLERQYNGWFDTYHCTNFGYAKPVASVFNYQLDNPDNRWITEDDIQWLHNNGYIVNGRVNFSEWYSGLTSGTRADVGNSGRTVATAGREFGMIPEAMLPFLPTTQKKDFFDKKFLTKERLDLGKEFARRFDVRFKFLNPNIQEQLNYWSKFSPITVYIATSCPWVYNVQQKCFNTTNHCDVYMGDEDQDEIRLGETYYRKAKDGTYKLERRVVKDFVYYNIAYVYMVRSKSLKNKEEDMKFIQAEGDKNIYLDTGNGTKQMVVDIETKEALEGKRGDGTLIWTDRIID